MKKHSDGLYTHMGWTVRLGDQGGALVYGLWTPGADSDSAPKYIVKTLHEARNVIECKTAALEAGLIEEL